MPGLPRKSRSTVLSVAVHGVMAAALLWTARLHGPILAPRHLAGTAHGTEVMLSYERLGSPPGVASGRPSKRTPAPAPPAPHKSSSRKAIQISEPAVLPAVGNSSEGSAGDGEISIALVQFHPRPQPDLSGLPAGAGGDVVLDALIDATGHIAQLTVSKSLGSAVDQQVISTVQQWTFTPAMRNGTPIASEQEILFHYERPQSG